MCVQDAVEENVAHLGVQGSLPGAGTSKLSLPGGERCKGNSRQTFDWQIIECLLCAYCVRSTEKRRMPKTGECGVMSKSVSSLIPLGNCILGGDRR